MKMVFGMMLLGILTGELCAAESVMTSPELRATSGYWHETPAKVWSEATPLGNGRMGAMIFGEIQQEQILLNESSIWVSPKQPEPNNPKGPELIPQIRKLLFENKYTEASKLCENSFLLARCGVNSYQPLGTLHLNHTLSAAPVENYRRALDMEKAVATVTFKQDGVKYTRESFVSFPDSVVVLRYRADQSGKISFQATMDRPADFKIAVTGDREYRLSGSTAKKDHHGVTFESRMHIQSIGGTFRASDTALFVENADEAVIYISAATDYNFKNPHIPLKRDLQKLVSERVNAAAAKPYDTLKTAHNTDFQSLFSRTAFNFNTISKTGESVSKRIDAVKKGQKDDELLLIYYDFCRYCLISVSREGGLPCNLQGIWNPHMTAPWESDWHLDINTQMFYWPSLTWNLAECQEPVFSLAEMLVPMGKKTAESMLGVKRGSMATTCTDAWGYTTPFRVSCWGMYVMGNAWLMQHGMEQYHFTQDKTFLKERLYPLLKSQSEFMLGWLTEHPATGQWVSGPSASPENSFYTVGRKGISIDMGPSHDQEVIWSTFRDYLEAARILGVNDSEVTEVKTVLKKLALPKIGADGRLMEWSQEFDEAEPGHRHLSHLWGFMPGNRITLRGTPMFAEAVRNSVNARLKAGFSLHGWSCGWMSCLKTRLGEPESAYDLMATLNPTCMMPNMFIRGGSVAQVADMCGVPCAMNEMVLQSHAGEIELLPSLPKAFADGSLKGFAARGGFLLDASWHDGKLVSATLKSTHGNPCTVRYGSKTVSLQLKAGESCQLTDLFR